MPVFESCLCHSLSIWLFHSFFSPVYSLTPVPSLISPSFLLNQCGRQYNRVVKDMGYNCIELNPTTVTMGPWWLLAVIWPCCSLITLFIICGLYKYIMYMVLWELKNLIHVRYTEEVQGAQYAITLTTTYITISTITQKSYNVDFRVSKPVILICNSRFILL